MFRHPTIWALSTFLFCSSGCAICESPFDYTYDAFGGRWQRTDACCGRVGSAFTPVGVRDQPEMEQPTPAEAEPADEYLEEETEKNFEEEMEKRAAEEKHPLESQPESEELMPGFLDPES
jgi:hypothetical protein